MSDVRHFKCPSCGAYLEYLPGTESLLCPYCGITVSAKEVAQAVSQTASQAEAAPEAQQAASSDGLKEYHCQSCGAQIVTGATTAATRCYFCHNPVVLTDRLSGSFKPDWVIPFAINREEAEKAFETYLSKKKYVDRQVFSREQREMFSGVYYPYWLGEISGQAVFDGEGVRTSVSTRGDTVTTTRRYYRVEREGSLTFRNLFRSALKSNDRKLTDGIQPYKLSAMKPFDPLYLSGYLAEMRDVEKDVTAADMLDEVKGYTRPLMTQGVRCESVSGSCTFTPKETLMRYVLLPAWVLTYSSGGQSYYYLMNAQTGTVCGRLPINRGKLIRSGLAWGAAIAGLLAAGGAFIW